MVTFHSYVKLPESRWCTPKMRSWCSFMMCLWSETWKNSRAWQGKLATLTILSFLSSRQYLGRVAEDGWRLRSFCCCFTKFYLGCCPFCLDQLQGAPRNSSRTHFAQKMRLLWRWNISRWACLRMLANFWWERHLLVGGLEHFWCSHILGIIIPIDFHIFQRGWNHQPVLVEPPDFGGLNPMWCLYIPILAL